MTRVEKLIGAEVLQVCVVGTYFDLATGTDKPMSPSSESFYHSEKFFIIDFVIDFRFAQLASM